MKSVFRQAVPGDRANVIRFLTGAFHATGSEPSLGSAQMQWKYEEQSAEPNGWTCRNFILEQDGRILSHAGVWPVRMIFQQQQYPGAHLIDWAAVNDAPGAGVSLLQKIGREEKIIYGLGGSEMTRKIFPSFGFRPLGAPLGYYARPLRPLRQIVTHPQGVHWKAPARFLRNAFWSKSAGISLENWSAAAADPRENSAWPSSYGNAAVFHRDAPGFEYLRRCPVIRTRFYMVRKADSLAGYFLLVFVPGQARIADAWIQDGGPQSWQKLFALAEAEARKDPKIAELTTIAGLSAARDALSACGFQQIKEEQLMVYDPQRLLPSTIAQVHFQLVDNDACYLHEGRPAYQT